MAITVKPFGNGRLILSHSLHSNYLTCSTRLSFDVQWTSMKPLGLADLETMAYLHSLARVSDNYL